MTKVNTFSAKGMKQTDTLLPKCFEEKENPKLLSQAIHVYRERAHIGLARTKTRGEVARTTKKWYRQKGTGGARHGARSAPIFVGGGVAHGPKSLRRELVLPEKMKRKALDLAFSAKAKEGKVVVVNGLSTLNKTNQVAKLIEKFQDKNKKINKFTFVLDKESSINKKIFRNISNVYVKTFDSINAHDVFFGGMLVFDKDVLVKKEKNKKL